MLRNSLCRVLPTLAVVAVAVTLMGCPPAEVGDRGVDRGSNLTSEPLPEQEPPTPDDSDDSNEATAGADEGG